MKDIMDGMLVDAEEFFNGGRHPQPRGRGQQGEPVRKSKESKGQHGEAEIGLVMEIKHVSRAMAIKILDARAIRLEAERAKEAAESKRRRFGREIDL